MLHIWECCELVVVFPISMFMQFPFDLCAKSDLRISNYAAMQALSGSQVYKTRVLNTRYFEIMIKLIEFAGLLISDCFDYVLNGYGFMRKPYALDCICIHCLNFHAAYMQHALQHLFAINRFTMNRFTMNRFLMNRFTMNRFTLGRFKQTQ